MKQTEIGMIPDDWEVKEIGSIGKMFSTGATPYRAISEYYKGNIKWVSSGELNYNFIEDTIEHISETGRRNTNLKLHPKGTFLMAITGLEASGTRGRCAILNVEATTNQSCLAIYPTNYLDVIYFFYFYQQNANLLAFKYCQGTKQQSYTASIVKKFLIPIPPTLSEQQKIAKALSDVDNVISTLEKLITKEKNLKQGTMQQLLTGKKRLPGFAPAVVEPVETPATKQTELGEIPADWEVKTLSEIFDFKPNNTFTRDDLNDSKGIYQNVHYGDVLIKYQSILDCDKEKIPYINENVNVRYSKYGIKEGDIIIADTAEDETVGKVVEIYNLGNRKLVSGLHTFLCRKITDDFAPRWLGYFMNQAIFHNQLLPYITGTKVSAISRNAIQNVKVFIPSKSEQTAIANVLSSMDKEIEALNTKLEKYRNLKTGMMQQLLTGKIRLV